MSGHSIKTMLANMHDPYDVRLQQPAGGRQADECFRVRLEESDTLVNIHDYDTIYRHPFLYDLVLYKYLKCETPFEIADSLGAVWQKAGVDPAGIRMLDIGAGSGTFAWVLRETLGIGSLTGLDLFPAAAKAAERDRPGLYDGYYVDDLTALSSATQQALRGAKFNCVGVASATGWNNHIPVAGFETAFQLLRRDGWFIFHVKPGDPDPECQALCAWIDAKISDGALDVHHRASHFHRRNSAAEPIYYDVVVGRRT